MEEGPANRRDVRAFITWVRNRRLIGDLTISLAAVLAPSVFTTEREQADQLHQCLTDATMPIDVRTAGALTLLFGLRPTRLLELTVHDLVDDETSNETASTTPWLGLWASETATRSEVVISLQRIRRRRRKADE